MFKDKETRKMLQEAVSRLEDRISFFDSRLSENESFAKKILEKTETLNKVINEVLVKIISDVRSVDEREKLNSDFLKKEISEVISFNRDLFVKDFLFNTTKDIRKEFESFKSSILKPLLEARWEYEKAKQGQAVISRGAKIIEERNKLHEEMLAKERTGQDFEKEKIQLATMDKIIQEAKE